MNTLYKLDLSLLERLSILAFILGIVGVFQGGTESLYLLGRGLLVLGVLGYSFSQLPARIGWQRFAERTTLLLLMIGILGMFQPWEILYYEYGFYLTGLSTLAFIIISHLPAKDENV